MTSWLRQGPKSHPKINFPNNSLTKKDQTIFSEDLKTEEFRPQDFFISGWSGDSLVSKNIVTTLNTIKIIEKDVTREFKSQGLFNKSLKNEIFNEFLAFAEAQALHCPELDQYQVFWSHLNLKDGPYKKELNLFLSIYFLRVAFIYIFKLRFLTMVCKECGLNVEDKDLFNPNSFFTQLFRPGSSLEIKSEALESNHFSWYRPHPSLIHDLKKLAEALPQLSSGELLKGMFQTLENSYFPDLETQQKYSHSLSHVSTGLFINSLVLKLPKWIQDKEKNQDLSYQNRHKQFPRPIYSKFTGDHLPSLTLSHWLAQEKYMNKKWDQIIYPEFFDQHFVCGKFMKICSELQFLCLLCSCANKQGHNPLSYIANIFHKRGQSLNSEEQQISMFDEVDHNPNMVYDRIILNLVDFPKNNPHFFLINQINSQHNDLKDDGLLFVLSSKKLFVPSQSEKVEQLLNKFKLEFVLGLDGIKNKGELASYIYVFRKTKLNTEESQDSFFLSNEEFGPFSSSLAMAKKSSCYSFRFSGDLSCYQKFNSFVEEINHFFSNKRVDSTPIYQSEFGDGFTIEFYQDAVVDGKLINSTKDPSHITHPNFFKNLMKSCIPLDYFFQIEPLSPGEESREGQLGLSFRKHDQYPYLLIVDFRNTHQVQLELTRIEAYEAKKEEYGNALCFYYGLISKRTDININLFREYLNSKLGLQLIQLSLYGKMSKLKSRLNEILIPKFFSESLRLPKHIEDSLVYFSYAEENLLQMHPQELENNFNKLTPTISSLWQKYPWSVMGLLSYFRMKLQNIQGKLINTKEKSGINYNSALIRDQIIKAPTSPIFPNNAEIYTEFKFKFQHEINLPLTEIILSNRDSQGEILYFLELQNSGKTIVELHSELVLLNFIKFILTNSLNIPISQLLQSLRIPSAKTLRILFSSIEGTQSIFTELEKRTHGLIENLINSQISIFEEKKKEINNQDSDKDCIFWS